MSNELFSLEKDRARWHKALILTISLALFSGFLTSSWGALAAAVFSGWAGWWLGFAIYSDGVEKVFKYLLFAQHEQSHAACLEQITEQEIATKDRYEDFIGDMAAELGCEREWSNLHDHLDCIPELISKLKNGKVESRVEQDINNHAKHYRGLVHWLRAHGEGPFTLAEMFSEGGTVAHEIWRRNGGEEGVVQPDFVCDSCQHVIRDYEAFCASCGRETGIDWS